LFWTAGKNSSQAFLFVNGTLILGLNAMLEHEEWHTLVLPSHR
jgi:hypothetical protein